MDNQQNLKVALVSLYPRFADSILSGEKKVEFRKTRMSEEISRVVIYSTSPVKKVVGYFDVKEIVAKKPLALWKEFKDTSGLEFGEYTEYYNGKEKAFGIVVGNVVKLETPLNLEKLGVNNPPQSFMYLDWRDIEEELIGNRAGLIQRFKLIVNWFLEMKVALVK